MKKLFIILAFFLLAPMAHAAVAFDNTAELADTSSGANTFSYTMGSGANGILIVAAYSIVSITSITYNGTSLTLLADSPNTNYGYYYLKNPTSGAHNIVITRGGANMDAASAIAMSFTGVQQTGNPFGTVQANSGSSKTGYSNSFTTLNAGSMAVDFIATGGSPGSAPSPVTATGSGHIEAGYNYI